MYMYLKKVISRKNSFLLESLMSMTKIAGSGAGFGSISHRHGSADPDPYQNVTDLQHWYEYVKFHIEEAPRYLCDKTRSC
jgi:hypothetical protein